jgi:5-methylcytosine-specific restriction endonuclease McrA
MAEKLKRVSWNKGRTTPEEVKQKMRVSHNPKSNKNLASGNRFKFGGVPWNKGLFGYNDGHEVTGETKKKISEANAGKPSWTKGKHLSEETKKKISAANRGKKFTVEAREKMKMKALIKWQNPEYIKAHSGENAPMCGKHQTDEAKAKTRERMTGCNNPFFGKKCTVEHKMKISAANTGKRRTQGQRINQSEAARKSGKTTWNGGSSFFPYSADFTKVLREQIRARDGHTCQLCGATGGSLAVHHIDYDRQNTNTENLISLCVSCHPKTNVRRSEWIEFFKGKAVANA